MAISEEDGSPVCPHCIAPINQFDHFCPRCGGPVTAHASNDPLGQIRSVGRAYSNATNIPRRIVVIGVWLIFGPQTLLLLSFLFAGISSLLGARTGHSSGGGIISDILKLMLIAGFLGLDGAILYKVTSRYIRATRASRYDYEPQWPDSAPGFPVIPLPPVADIDESKHS